MVEDHITIENQQTLQNNEAIINKVDNNNDDTDDDLQQPAASTALQYFSSLRQTLKPKKSEKSNFSMPAK